MNKKKVVVFSLITFLIALIVVIYPVRNFYLNQIGNILRDSILNKSYSSECISEKNKQKILDDIYWDGNDIRIKSVECAYDNENWIKRYVKVAVYLETNEGKNEKYYKCYFKIDKGRVYITQIGLYLDEEGTITDLD